MQRKKLREVKEEAKNGVGLNYRQMSSIIERCDYSIRQLENPAKPKEYTPNKYDEQRIKLKGSNSKVA